LTDDLLVPPERSAPAGQRRRRSQWRITRSKPIRRLNAALFHLVLGAARLIGRKRAKALAVVVIRAISPYLRENRVAIANIAMAFPEKSEAERQEILRGSWANLAMTLAEFAFLEEIAAEADVERLDRGPITATGLEQFVALRDDGKPGVIFAAHLANWELLGVCAAKFGLKVRLPFRAPSNPYIADYVLKHRQQLMGGGLVPNRRGAAVEVAKALDQGEHLGMLIDQRLATGRMIPFFGRPAPTNPIVGTFARRLGCPVHGARTIRRPDGGFHFEVTPPLDLPRDASGSVDVDGALTAINAVVERWVREHPDQWLWIHNRWGSR
jgi:KDO2-lipid IV(A) lauroyltransferase